MRVDASPQIGHGHLRRCLALGQALSEAGADVVLVTRPLGVDTQAMARSAGVAHRSLPAPSGSSAPAAPSAVPHAAWAQATWREDAAQTAAALLDWAPDWVVVDHYAFDAQWHREVAAALAARMAVIDDLADRDLNAALLIDHNHAPDHHVKYAGRVAADCMLLDGPRFALLAPQYANAARYRFHEQVRSIGVFMGGVDADALSSRVIQACREHARFAGPIEVVTTRSNPHLEELMRACAGSPATTLIIEMPEMSAFFARHDLQIGAGGVATWERCCIGVPTLALVCADNQRAVVPALAALGVLATPQPADDLGAAAIGRAVSALLPAADRRCEMSAHSRRLVDGLGARRVALSIAVPALRVRAATFDDARLMHHWRNHPATRAVSRNADEIAWPAHAAWLERTLVDPARTLLVGGIGSIDVGVIRFDRQASGDVQVSLYLDPALHRLGLGSALLRAGEAHVAGRGARFVATVVDRNAGSQRLFAAAGYRERAAGCWIKDAGVRRMEAVTR